MTRRPKKAKSGRARKAANQMATRDNLLSALRAFADVELPPPGAGRVVWFYVGHEDPNGSNPGHLSIDDFKRARRMVYS